MKTSLKTLLIKLPLIILISQSLLACNDRVKEVVILPPELLIQDTHKPERQGSLTKDVFINEKNRGIAIDACNADKKLLREWRLQNSNEQDR